MDKHIAGPRYLFATFAFNARDTSICVVAFHQIRFHRKTIKRRSCLRSRSRPSSEKLQIDGMRILFKFARQNEREDRKKDGMQRKFAISKYSSESTSEKGGGTGKQGGWRDLKPLASSSSRRNCYFNSTFLSLARR